jgi:hypothetical protein
METTESLKVATAFAEYLADQGPHPEIEARLLEGIRSGDLRRAFVCALALRGNEKPDVIEALHEGLHRIESEVGCACALGPVNEKALAVLKEAILLGDGGSDLCHHHALASILAVTRALRAPEATGGAE